MPLYTVFSAVLNMSITASIAIIVVLLARIILKHAPKIFSYALWAVVLFRLLCPVSLTSQFSLMGLFPALTTEAGSVEYVSLNELHTERPAITVDIPASDLNQTTDNRAEVMTAGSIDVLVSIASIVWICGVAAMLLFHLLQLIRLRRKLTGAIPLKDNIYLADYIPTPFVMGLIHPKIYLPSAMSEAEQSYIIQHEKHHIRRCDHMIKLLAFAAMCIHWFNPFVWLAFALSSKDMEMSCDEAVMKQMGRDIRADYSSSLLQFSTGKRVIVGAPLAFGEGDTKERIVNIMRYKKPTLMIVVSAVIVCVVLTACLSSNPQRLSAMGALKEEDIGKTLSELKNEHPEGEFVVSFDGFPDSAAICFGEPGAEYLYYFFGTQSGDAEKAMNECEDQLTCAGFVTTANILFPDMEDEMSFEDFFSLIGVDDYEYLSGEDVITGEGWLRFTYHGMEVMVNTNETTPSGGWDITGEEIVKSNAPVSIVDTEILNTNQDLADAVMFD
ncbi:M56 family metallopeptidase [Flavonifractor sp. HCP28S3_F3]|uniref:M56 family metallopeptidase n=1 Tax=Flavonifractor sp. HCP28S3_F3 TaxID=3438939 RepID=UPI003F8A386C